MTALRCDSSLHTLPSVALCRVFSEEDAVHYARELLSFVTAHPLEEEKKKKTTSRTPRIVPKRSLRSLKSPGTFHKHKVDGPRRRRSTLSQLLRPKRYVRGNAKRDEVDAGRKIADPTTTVPQ